MNKKLIGMITSALVIGAASTALANPFADVPADHWAYDAIDQLVADGVIEGYANGTYNGDKEITRYEMAQMVARAMANCEGADAADKATIDKLAAEFSNELDALGVRVENLEKKVAGLQGLKVFGDTRLRYTWDQGGDAGAGPIQQRVRLGVKGDVNEDVSVFMRYMIENHTEWGDNDHVNELMDASLTWKNVLPHTNLTFGRFSQDFGISMYLLNSQGNVDGAKLQYKNKDLYVEAGYADFGNASRGFGHDKADYKAADKVHNVDHKGHLHIDQALFVQAKYQATEDLKLQGLYFKTENTDTGVNGADTYSIGAEWQFAKNLYLMGEYAQNSEIDGPNDDGSLVRLQYGKVSAAKPGSFALFVERNDWANGLLGDEFISLSHGECMGAAIGESNWQVGFDLALAKNIVWQNWYAWDRTGQDGSDKDVFGRTQINFSF